MKKKGYSKGAKKVGGKGRVANKGMSWDGKKQAPSSKNKGFGPC
jgi:hypothetical protein